MGPSSYRDTLLWFINWFWAELCRAWSTAPDGRPTRYGRSLAFLGGIVVPVVCFISAFSSGVWSGGSPWQSGRLEHYAVFLAKWPVVAPFYPLLAYSMICCGLATWGDRTRMNSIWVRGGLMTGIILAIQFHFIVYCPDELSLKYLLPGITALGVIAGFTAIAIVFLPLVWRLLAWTWRKWGGLRFCLGVTAVMVCCLLATGAAAFIADSLDQWSQAVLSAPLATVGLAWIMTLICGTTWSTLTYTLLTVTTWKSARDRRFAFGLLPLFGGFVWLTSYLAACRAAVQMAIVEYSKLPVENPNCYICTTAARGHRQWVGSRTVLLRTGRAVTVNRQMQYLKSSELILRCLFPTVHRRCRTAYDHSGPRLAAWIQSRWSADVAYVCLKPCEWLARMTITLLGVDVAAVHGLYSDSARAMTDGTESSRPLTPAP